MGAVRTLFAVSLGLLLTPLFFVLTGGPVFFGVLRGLETSVGDAPPAPEGTPEPAFRISREQLDAMLEEAAATPKAPDAPPPPDLGTPEVGDAPVAEVPVTPPPAETPAAPEASAADVRRLATIVRRHQPLNPGDLPGLACDALSLLRNGIWAAHGYRFRSDAGEVQFATDLLYEPSDITIDEVEAQLTPNDRDNRTALEGRLREAGCPCPRGPGPCPA